MSRNSAEPDQYISNSDGISKQIITSYQLILLIKLMNYKKS